MIDIFGLPAREDSVATKPPSHQGNEIYLEEAVAAAPEEATRFEPASPFEGLRKIVSGPTPFGGLFAATGIEETAEAVQVHEVTNEGLPPIAWAIMGGVVAFSLLAYFLEKHSRVRIYSKTQREVMGQGLRGLRHFGSEKVMKWIGDDRLMEMLDQNEPLEDAEQLLEVMIKGATAAMVFDPEGKTPLGNGAMSSLLGLYWDRAGDKRNSAAMRRAETKILEKGRPELLSELDEASVEHIRVIERLKEGRSPGTGHGELFIIRALHLFAAAQLNYSSAVNEYRDRSARVKLDHAEELSAEGLNAAIAFDRNPNKGISYDSDAVATILVQMDGLRHTIMERKSAFEGRGSSRGGSGTGGGGTADAGPTAPNGTILHCSAAGALAMAPLMLCPIV